MPPNYWDAVDEEVNGEDYHGDTVIKNTGNDDVSDGDAFRGVGAIRRRKQYPRQNNTPKPKHNYKLIKKGNIKKYYAPFIKAEWAVLVRLSRLQCNILN